MDAPEPPLDLLTTCFALAALAALVYLWQVTRGRRHGAEPSCRACGFSLVGHADQPVRCPECGRSLRRRGSIRRGRRERNGALVGFGWAIVAIIATGAALEYGPSIAGASWSTTAAAPTRWLVTGAIGGGPSAPDALDELVRRITAGKLTAAEARPLVQHALDLQADHERKWDARWGRIIESAGRAGLLGNPDIVRYLRQALVVDGKLHRPLRRARVVPQAGVQIHRFGDLAIDFGGIDVELRSATLEDEALTIRRTASRGKSWTATSSTIDSNDWRLATTKPAGTYELRLSWRAKLNPATLGADLPSMQLLGNLPAFSCDFESVLSATVLDADVDPFDPVEEDDRIAEIETQLAGRARIDYYPRRTPAQLQIQIDATPCQVAIDASAVLQIGEREITGLGDPVRLTGQTMGSMQWYWFHSHVVDFETLPPGPVSLRLEPMPAPDPLDWRPVLQRRDRLPIVRRPLVLRDLEITVHDEEPGQ